MTLVISFSSHPHLLAIFFICLLKLLSKFWGSLPKTDFKNKFKKKKKKKTTASGRHISPYARINSLTKHKTKATLKALAKITYFLHSSKKVKLR